LKYGARHLKRAIERHVVYPLASLLATNQVSLGDVISIDYREPAPTLTFMKEAEGALVPMDSPTPAPLAEAAAASSDGREISFPTNVTAAAELAPAVPAQRVLPVEKARHDKE
jgi:ATP-dependent Clp protease ATP-binding subunit ClpB